MPALYQCNRKIGFNKRKCSLNLPFIVNVDLEKKQEKKYRSKSINRLNFLFILFKSTGMVKDCFK